MKRHAVAWAALILLALEHEVAEGCAKATGHEGRCGELNVVVAHC